MPQPTIHCYRTDDADPTSLAPLMAALEARNYTVEVVDLPRLEDFEPDRDGQYCLLVANNWVFFPRDGDREDLQALVNQATLVVIPHGAWQPQCPKPKPEEDPEIYADISLDPEPEEAPGFATDISLDPELEEAPGLPINVSLDPELEEAPGLPMLPTAVFPKPESRKPPEILTDFSVVLTRFDGKVAAIHLAWVKNWLNCDVAGECPGVLGCP